MSNVLLGRVNRREVRYPFKRPKHGNSNVQRGKRSWLSWLTIITAFISLSTTALVLLGYGYSLAVESVFGIKAELVGNSVGDYLRFSTYVIAGFAEVINTKTFQWDIYSHIYHENKAWIITLTLLWVGFGIVWFLLSGQASQWKRLLTVKALYWQGVPDWLQSTLRAMFLWLVVMGNCSHGSS